MEYTIAYFIASLAALADSFFVFANIVLLTFIAGALVKFADDLSDGRIKADARVAYALALAYGLLLGVVLSLKTETMTWGLAVVAAVLVYGKVDKAHQFGVAAIIAALAFLGIPEIEFPLFAAFLLCAVLDEALSDRGDRAEKRGEETNALVKFALGSRLLLPLACIIAGFALGKYIYIVAMAGFEIGYVIAAGAPALLKEKKKWPAGANAGK
ncbi:MAG: hypothetical protein V1676_01070 [Candidatus Diapherotrites archaeon]